MVEWLKLLQAGHSEARSYAYTSLAGIQPELGLPGALFDTLLVVENYPAAETSANRHGLQISDIVVKAQGNHPLTLVVLPGECITIRFSYRTDLLSQAVVMCMQQHFEHLLGQVLANAQVKTGGLSVLPSGEWQLLLEKFQPPARQFTTDKTLVQLFEEQAARTPDNLAVAFADKLVTYRQLSEWSAQLACILQEQGVKTETLVPICVERSPELIAGVLAILKAGGAYVPLDPNLPTGRMEYILADTRSRIVLTNKANQAKITSSGEQKVLLLDQPEKHPMYTNAKSVLLPCSPHQIV